jgi:hypothetical protein
MTTAAAIDRLVHHSIIIELTSKRSYRNDVAIERNDNYDDNYEEGLSNASAVTPKSGRENQPDGEV